MADAQTFAPWSYGLHGTVYGSDGRAVLYVPGARMDFADAEGKPGQATKIGTLAAAAPDMRDALKVITEWILFNYPVEPEGWNEAFVKANNLAHAALAKAEALS